MKKLIIACAVAVLGIAVNAATVNWSATSIAEYGKTTNVTSSLGYIGVLINAGITDRDTMLTALGKGDTSLVAGATIASSQTTVGTAAAGMAYVTGAGSFGDGETINAYALIFDADSVASAEHVFATSELASATGAKGQAATFAFGALTGTQDAANWQAIPEPTSGMLLLVGCALMALKRKRA